MVANMLVEVETGSGVEVPARAVLWSRRMDTPLGDVLAVAHDEGIVVLEFVDGRSHEATLRRARAALAADGALAEVRPGSHPHLDQLEREIAEYFAGTRRTFTVPLDPHGTAFERRAWQHLQTIPFGQTHSYGQQARAIGMPSAVRAVGGANGRNGIAIVVPCHRVIGASGSLTGYGGGLARKRWLLEHERRALAGAAAAGPTNA